jgi:ABC-type transport system substrate-binding protein
MNPLPQAVFVHSKRWFAVRVWSPGTWVRHALVLLSLALLAQTVAFGQGAKVYRGEEWLGFNVRLAPFDNVKVRQAIHYGIDRRALASLFSGPGIEPALTLLPPTAPGYDPARALPFSPERAQQLLAEAGLGPANPPPVLTLWTNTANARRAQAAARIIEDLKRLGFSVSIQDAGDSASFTRLVAQGQARLMLYGTSTGTNLLPMRFEPENYANFFQARFGTGGTISVFSYSNARVDELITELRSSRDPAMIARIAGEIESIILQDSVLIPLAWTLQ